VSQAQFASVGHARRVLGAIAVAAALVLGYANIHVNPDAAPPARLASIVDYARSLVRSEAGLIGTLPFRFVEARCDADGYAVLVFESGAGVRLYAYVSAPPPADGPDPVQVIHTMPAAEYFESSFSRTAYPCETGVVGRAGVSCRRFRARSAL
jgi:hypothetical protein